MTKNNTVDIRSYSIVKDMFVFGKDTSSTLSVNFAYSTDYFSRRFKRAIRKAGFGEEIHFHTLRHSFASNLAQKGVNLYTIKELLGHSSISVTEIYSHLNVDSLREAIDKFRSQNTEGSIQNGKEMKVIHGYSMDNSVDGVEKDEIPKPSKIKAGRQVRNDTSTPLSINSNLRLVVNED